MARDLDGLFADLRCHQTCSTGAEEELNLTRRWVCQIARRARVRDVALCGGAQSFSCGAHIGVTRTSDDAEATRGVEAGAPIRQGDNGRDVIAHAQIHGDAPHVLWVGETKPFWCSFEKAAPQLYSGRSAFARPRTPVIAGSAPVSREKEHEHGDAGSYGNGNCDDRYWHSVTPTYRRWPATARGTRRIGDPRASTTPG